MQRGTGGANTRNGSNYPEDDDMDDFVYDGPPPSDAGGPGVWPPRGSGGGGTPAVHPRDRDGVGPASRQFVGGGQGRSYRPLPDEQSDEEEGVIHETR